MYSTTKHAQRETGYQENRSMEPKGQSTDLIGEKTIYTPASS